MRHRSEVGKGRGLIVWNGAALAGAAIMIGSESATLARIEPFYSWNTPICWTGFIVFADAIVHGARGRSLIRSSPHDFAWLACLSIPLWLVFEGYNRVIRNWYYVGLPENRLLRYFGYGWSFATIWPAIFEGADLIGVVWGVSGASGGPRRAGGGGMPGSSAGSGGGGRFSTLAVASIMAGAAMLVSPFLVRPDVARYLAAPVWLGFIFLLDPINARLGGASLAEDRGRTMTLLSSGLLCGVLWELWNYWAGAKWHYTVPIMEQTRIFEMPLPGYLGFPPFALECFTMFEFVRLMFRRVAG